MSEAFEDPRKTEMRDRCAIAIDNSGHEVASVLQTVEVGGIKGKLRGDLQSVDGAEVRHMYYLRTDAKKAVPPWIVEFVRASEALQAVEVHVVAGERGATLERSCRSARVSLLLVTDDNAFERLVDPAEVDEEEVAAAHVAACRDARRRLMTKLNLNQGAIERNYSRVTELTTGMAFDVREQYIEGVTFAAAAWDEWSRRVSAMLDEAEADGNVELLAAAEALIEAGPGDSGA